MMKIQRIENDIDTLLRYMNHNIEALGYDIEQAFFAFTEEKEVEHMIGDDLWSTIRLKNIIKFCMKRTLLKYAFAHNHDYFQEVSLTTKGKIRAVFAEEDHRICRVSRQTPRVSRVYYQPTSETRKKMELYEPTFGRLIKSVETAAYPLEEREEASSRIRRLLEYPLVYDITGGIAEKLLHQSTHRDS